MNDMFEKKIITFHGRFSFIHDLSNGPFSIVIRGVRFFKYGCSHWSEENTSRPAVGGPAIRCHSDQDHVCKEPQVDSKDAQTRLGRSFLWFFFGGCTTESNETLWYHLDNCQHLRKEQQTCWQISEHFWTIWGCHESWYHECDLWWHERRTTQEGVEFFGSETVRWFNGSVFVGDVGKDSNER